MIPVPVVVERNISAVVGGNNMEQENYKKELQSLKEWFVELRDLL